MIALPPTGGGRKRLNREAAIDALLNTAAEVQVSAAAPSDEMIAAAIAEFDKVSSWPEYDWKDAIELALTAALKIRASEGQTQTSDETIDRHLDAILKASGSGLRYFTMSKTRDDMRAALRNALKGTP